MEDLGMSYTYSDMDKYKDEWMPHRDNNTLRIIGEKFLSDLMNSPNPVVVKISRSDEPSGYGQRTVTFRLHVRHVQSMNVVLYEPELEDMPTRFVVWNYKQELIRRFKRFVHRSIHGY